MGQALGAIVFSDKREKAKLEAIVWPEIKRLIELDLVSLKEVGGWVRASDTWSTVVRVECMPLIRCWA